jgi:hypothetical protein
MGIQIMKWEEDLLSDIRFGNGQDDADCLDYDSVEKQLVKHRLQGIKGDFTPMNREFMRKMLIKFDPKNILEIGVEQNPENETSTSAILNYKSNTVKYFGVDINDKEFLYDPERNIFPIKSDSSDYYYVKDVMENNGVTELDFIFIDGWHSINQVLKDWEYTKLLSPKGIVGFHDINYHPGPNRFFEAIDETKWNKQSNPSGMGIGFVWPKNP